MALPNSLRCPLLAATASSSTLRCCRGTACASELARKVCRIHFSLPRLLPYGTLVTYYAHVSLSLSAAAGCVCLLRNGRNSKKSFNGRFDLTNCPPHRPTSLYVPNGHGTAKQRRTECSESEPEQQIRKLREGGDTAVKRETANYDLLTVTRAGDPDVQESWEEDAFCRSQVSS